MQYETIDVRFADTMTMSRHDAAYRTLVDTVVPQSFAGRTLAFLLLAAAVKLLVWDPLQRKLMVSRAKL